MSAKALREKRAKIAASIQEMRTKLTADNRDDFTAEETTGWEAAVADYDKLTKAIEREERMDAIETEQKAAVGDPRVGRTAINTSVVGGGAETAVTEEHRALALQAWARHGENCTDRHREACRLTGLNVAQDNLTMQLFATDDYRRLQAIVRDNHPTVARGLISQFGATMSGLQGSTGGFLVPPETLMRSLEINMLWFGGMRQAAEVIRTGSGERISWPTSDDTTNKGVLLGQNQSIGSSVDPSFAKVYWDAYKFSSQPILVPYELLQDSAFNLAEILGQMLGERLGRITNTYYTTGTGAAQPKGIVPASTLAVTTATNAAITADNLIDLFHGVDKAYRNGFTWMFHDNTLAAVRKLKDANNQYLWVPSIVQGLQPGIADLLFGAPYITNNDMAQIGANSVVVLGGQLSRYKIRTVGEVRMYRLQERYRDTDQDAFLALIREDGNLLTSGTAPVKNITMHS